jgi:hypothetical protein
MVDMDDVFLVMGGVEIHWKFPAYDYDVEYTDYIGMNLDSSHCVLNWANFWASLV